MRTAGAVPLRPLNRATPVLPAGAYETFSIASPPATHRRPALCSEVGCHRADGWVTTVDESTERGRLHAWHIRNRAGRRYRESRNPAGMTVFTFAPRQRCFANHTKAVARPALLIVRDGDWRGNPTGRRRTHARAAHWVEHMAESLERTAALKRRG